MSKQGPDNSFPTAFRNFVDAHMKENPGATFASIAAQLDCPQSAVSDYYNARKANPTLNTLRAIHNVFNISYAYLAGEIGFPDNDSMTAIESDVARVKLHTMAYDQPLIVDNVIRAIDQTSQPGGFYFDGPSDPVEVFNGLGRDIIGSSLDGISQLVLAMVKVKDKAFELALKQRSAAALLEAVERGQPCDTSKLGRIINDIANARGIYDDLDRAVSMIKESINEAIARERQPEQ
jgi:transcriptional regulator with XRE-family HTH domain